MISTEGGGALKYMANWPSRRPTWQTISRKMRTLSFLTATS
jgi:hypothetical protein